MTAIADTTHSVERLSGKLPGIALCAAVTASAYVLQAAETRFAGQAYLEALVLAILLGVAVRTAWTPPARVLPGVKFSAHMLLEIAVMLLGASVSLRVVAAAGPMLLAGIAGIVVAALALGYGICRALGLPRKMAALVACGNAICGNSAIAAVAPVIGADADEITSAIAFTAILGVAVVLGLPVLLPAIGLSGYAYGVFSGLTVYAVPQVLAATATAGALAVQVGTMVKLVRVLMLGPVVLGLSLIAGRKDAGGRIEISHLVPWFIVGFLVLATARSLGAVPGAAVGPIGSVATILTVVSMAALGLGVDIRVLGRVGPRVVAAVTLSLVALGGVSFGLIRLLGL